MSEHEIVEYHIEVSGSEVKVTIVAESEAAAHELAADLDRQFKGEEERDE
jgi:hypothetical protein